MYWNLLWIVFVVCLAACACGFKKFVWFMSIGYGFAIAAGAVAIGIIFAVLGKLAVLPVIMLILCVIYGIRLGGFLLVREMKNASYRKTLDEATKTEKPIPVFVLAFMWLFMGVLYTIQLSPVFYRLANESADLVFGIIGIVVSALGIFLEAEADRQKSEQKKKNPRMAATEGLYKLVRCPNYLGELTFWTGTFIGSWGALNHWGQWVMAVLAWISIIIIMFNGAQRLEKRQNGNYGSKKEYQEYVKKTPIIIPFIPLYTLNKSEVKK
ncbi:MAG: DUF1295 domain-containing protein [Oscillospiraceae bacterium]|nr:DUF1295 domain-containing protein [Oscillospiraceae bacterium]